MKVKSLKTLKEIFKSEGISEQYYKKLTNKNKEQVLERIKEYNQQNKEKSQNIHRISNY
jgi:hypothetical protein